MGPGGVGLAAGQHQPKVVRLLLPVAEAKRTKRAIVAVARKLLCVLYAMLKTSTPYKVLPTAPMATGTRRKRLVRIRPGADHNHLAGHLDPGKDREPRLNRTQPL